MTVGLDRFFMLAPPEYGMPPLTSPILFLNASPRIYENECETYLFRMEIWGGCTAHIREKTRFIMELIRQPTISRFINLAQVIAGPTDIFARFIVPKGDNIKSMIEQCVQQAIVGANEWLKKECESYSILYYNIIECPKVKKTHYDFGWKLTPTVKSTNAESYYIMSPDIPEKLGNMWFLENTARQALAEFLLHSNYLKNLGIDPDEIQSKSLYPLYIPEEFQQSLIYHTDIVFRQPETPTSLLDALDLATRTPKKAKTLMEKHANVIKDYLFRFEVLTGNRAWLTFIVPDLKTLYRTEFALQNTHELHRIRTYVSLHSFILKPPFTKVVE